MNLCPRSKVTVCAVHIVEAVEYQLATKYRHRIAIILSNAATNDKLHFTFSRETSFKDFTYFRMIMLQLRTHFEVWCETTALMQLFLSHRDVVSLTVKGGQEFHFLHFSITFSNFFPKLISVLILTLRVGESPTWADFTTAFMHYVLYLILRRILTVINGA